MEKLTVLNAAKIINPMSVTAEFEDGSKLPLLLTAEGGVNTIRFKSQSDAVQIEIEADSCGDTVIFSLKADSDSAFSAGDILSFRLSFDKVGEIDAMTANYLDKPWWMLPKFCSSFAELSEHTQNITVKSGDTHYYLMPLVGDVFKCEANGEGLHIRSGAGGLHHLEGPFLAVSAAGDPFDAVSAACHDARRCGAVRVPLREERECPAQFQRFGWCSWDAFYRDITSEGLYQKLDELKEKGIRLKWLIIDDGWSEVKDNKLWSFDVEKKKFPEGLARCIRKIKEQYGVSFVGVWHAFNGYWDGIHPESPLVSELGDALYTTKEGMVIPSPIEGKAFPFYEKWHAFLESCGVDFLKVDVQSSSALYLSGNVPTSAGARAMHHALEKSIGIHFCGRVINCMGHDMDNVLSRPHSAVSRNSDDFFPNVENGFRKHLIQNAYTAVWHSQFYDCDYDMWWTDHPSAVQSGVLRAISGGPVYVSDKVGHTRKESLLPVCDENGLLAKLDSYAVPVLSCYYTDCTACDKLFAVQNRSGDCLAAAVYNLRDHEVTDAIRLSDLRGIESGREYAAYEYFSKKFIRVTDETVLPLTLPKDGVACFTLFPVTGSGADACIRVGDLTKYIAAGWEKEKTLFLSDLDFADAI